MNFLRYLLVVMMVRSVASEASAETSTETAASEPTFSAASETTSPVSFTAESDSYSTWTENDIQLFSIPGRICEKMKMKIFFNLLFLHLIKYSFEQC